MTNTSGHVYELGPLAEAIKAEFPELEDGRRPLAVLGEGYDSLAVETGSGIVIRLPKRPAVAEAMAIEARLLELIGPTLPVAVPVPEWVGTSSATCPWGYVGYRKIPGTILDLTALDGVATQRLVEQVAAFLAALHAFPVQQVADLRGPEKWQDHYEAVRDRVVPQLAGLLNPAEHEAVERWWREFLGAPQNWQFTPTLVHGDIAPQHLLVDGGTLTGVIDFGDARVGDPAVDFGGLVAYVDAGFAADVERAYERLRGDSGPGLLPRARVLAEATPFFSIYGATHHPGPGVPSVSEALAELRSSAILRQR